MLVLTRRLNETIVIGLGSGVRITLVGIERNKVRLGVEADPSVPVHRQEVWDLLHTPRDNETKEG